MMQFTITKSTRKDIRPDKHDNYNFKKESKMTENREILCGDLVVDEVTKIGGVVTCKTVYLFGMPRLTVQPRGSVDGKPHESLCIDIDQAGFIEAPCVSRKVPAVGPTLPLGSEYKDTITGYKGICTGVATFLYSCTRTLLTSQKLNKDGDVKSQWFETKQLEVVKEAVVKSEKAARPTGGPGGPLPDTSRRDNSSRGRNE